MKRIILAIFFIATTLSACKKEELNKAPEVIDVGSVDSTASTPAAKTLSGTFLNGPFGTTSGIVKILVSSSNMYSLVLDSFTVKSGPDLHVYLSKEVQPLNFIDLGKLKAVSGTQEYTIAGKPDFTQYKYALIHCQQFDHLFGSATLK